MKNFLKAITSKPSCIISVDSTLKQTGFDILVDDVKFTTTPTITKQIVSSPGFNNLSQVDKANVILGTAKALSY
jgi:hypothetical protein